MLWTEQNTERLKELWADDSISAAGIAKTLNSEFGLSFSRNSVIGKVCRLKLPGRLDPSFKQTNCGTPVRRPRKRHNSKPTHLDVVGLPPEPPKPPTCQPITFEQLQSDHCRWPIGEGPYLFCGDAKQPASSYCPYHHRIAYQPARAPAPFIPRRFAA